MKFPFVPLALVKTSKRKHSGGVKNQFQFSIEFEHSNYSTEGKNSTRMTRI
jgi:hypothetical protein